MKHLVVVGSVNVDIFLRVPHMPKIGETVLGNRFYWHIGGKGANQAVGIARLGCPVYFVGKVGNDPFKDRILGELEKEGVKTEFVVQDEKNPSGMAVITVDEKGRNFITVIGGSNRNLSCDDVEKAHEIIKDAFMVILQMEIPLETVRFTLRLAKKWGVRTLLNPAPANFLSSRDFSSIDLLVPNEDEAERLTGVQIKNLEDAEKAGNLLLKEGVQITVLTLGERGALLVTKEKTQHFPAVPVRPEDTTGAGDSFVAAFATALFQDKNLEEAVKYANYAASISVTRPGAQPSLPYKNEVENFMR